jgi:hypothetical protein
VVGESRNWQALLTEKEISGRVIVRYCKTPTRIILRTILSKTKITIKREELVSSFHRSGGKFALSHPNMS